MLLPGVAPHTGIEPLFSPVYDPLWALCQELAMPVTHHGGGSGVPDFGKYPASTSIFLMEVPFFANRALWHLIMSGVFDRFTDLVFVMTEQGSSWIPGVLQQMDDLHDSMLAGKFGEIGPSQLVLERRPSEYFSTNCYVGASFPTRSDTEVFRSVGIDRFMWGSDYPHREGTYPYTRESLRRTFTGWSEPDLRRLFAENAATVYGFDLDALDAMAASVGPTVEEVARPLDEIPADATSPAFFRD